MSPRQRLELQRAAVAWWQSKCPVAYDEAEHLKFPRVNTTTDAEARLAKAVAALVRSKQQPSDGQEKKK